VSAGIPLADARAFRPRAVATRVVLAALAVGAAVAAAGLLLASRFPHSQTLVLLPPKANVVIVLDLSASISSDSFSRIGGTLRVLSRSGDRVGLVIFSDEAYEALPSGTPAADLSPLVRYFTLARQSEPGLFPLNPWGNTFTGGTNIAAGMEMAIDIAVAQRPRAAVMLVSDLDDDPNNLGALSAVGAVAQRDRVPIRIVGLSPSPANVAYFRSVFGRSAPIVEAPTPAQATRQELTPFPWTLVVLAAVAAIVLALREGWAPRLGWRRSQ
jgi:uncharacterized protein (DUF58 family)